jgi:hypothetical protein
MTTNSMVPDVELGAQMRAELDAAVKTASEAYTAYQAALKRAEAEVAEAHRLYQIALGESHKLVTRYQDAIKSRAIRPHGVRGG